MKTGFVEQRQFERISVTLKAAYQLLNEDEARRYKANPDFVSGPVPGSSLRPGQTHDLSEGGMALVGADMFRAGYKLFVKFGIPTGGEEVTSVAEVRWVQQFVENARPMYRAGLKFLLMKKGDADRLNEYLKQSGTDHPKP